MDWSENVCGVYVVGCVCVDGMCTVSVGGIMCVFMCGVCVYEGYGAGVGVCGVCVWCVWGMGV